VLPRIVAVAMVLQTPGGLSDREATDRFSFDTRWKYAAGGLDFDYPGFAHTVLVDMRTRLARSAWPDRIFQAVDAAAREALVDFRSRDGFALPALLESRTLEPGVDQAARLPATVLGQDLIGSGHGCRRIARRVAPDRVISTVDPDTRHGHKTSARGFDGYKGHLAAGPAEARPAVYGDAA